MWRPALVLLVLLVVALPCEGARPRRSEDERSLAPFMPVDKFLLEVVPTSPACATTPNPAPLNFGAICPPGASSCWPSMYLMGVQKAGSTSITMGLSSCGLVALGVPSNTSGPLPAPCDALNVPCKETLHDPIDLTSMAGTARFTSLYNPSQCGSMVGPLKAATEPACRQGRFLSATPLWATHPGSDDDAQPNEISHLLQHIPSAVARHARFAIVLREPVSRLLSWYNHLLADATIVRDPSDPVDMSSFEGFFRSQDATPAPSILITTLVLSLPSPRPHLSPPLAPPLQHQPRERRAGMDQGPLH